MRKKSEDEMFVRAIIPIYNPQTGEQDCEVVTRRQYEVREVKSLKWRVLENDRRNS